MSSPIPKCLEDQFLCVSRFDLGYSAPKRQRSHTSCGGGLSVNGFCNGKLVSLNDGDSQAREITRQIPKEKMEIIIISSLCFYLNLLRFYESYSCFDISRYR